MRNQTANGWHRVTSDEVVDISPRGEEGMHIVDAGCECGPTISRDTEGRTMIIHRSWDGRAGFVAVDSGEFVVGRRAA